MEAARDGRPPDGANPTNDPGSIPGLPCEFRGFGVIPGYHVALPDDEQMTVLDVILCP